MEYYRTHIRLTTQQEAIEFISELNKDGSVNKYVLENFDGSERVNARSLLGVLYFTVEHNNDTYFVNMTNPQDEPLFLLDKFRC